LETTKPRIQKKLEEELNRLKAILGLGYDLIVKWVPDGKSKLSGEVRGNLVYIYEEEEEEAVETLRHEFIDFCISQVVEPYKDVTNLLIKKINKDAYLQKEKLVEALKRLFSSNLKNHFH
jgi:hypothetical protein